MKSRVLFAHLAIKINHNSHPIYDFPYFLICAHSHAHKLGSSRLPVSAFLSFHRHLQCMLFISGRTPESLLYLNWFLGLLRMHL